MMAESGIVRKRGSVCLTTAIQAHHQPEPLRTAPSMITVTGTATVMGRVMVTGRVMGRVMVTGTVMGMG
ncbi:hypothetical protein SAMN05660976_04992 [Nonomuraea pusilla]|uniref:Uncharacterized protein n=1 Tax=Nonomuraea pusilla TaxID=46177 RepID=A0A1H7XVF9_9ACTN|nr:hypothetical protein SAMN05660976_04992 [Nonomuraea pusilla]